MPASSGEPEGTLSAAPAAKTAGDAVRQAMRPNETRIEKALVLIFYLRAPTPKRAAMAIGRRL
jgi:hypothetical protein